MNSEFILLNSKSVKYLLITCEKYWMNIDEGHCNPKEKGN
jgi:hypothetical protein